MGAAPLMPNKEEAANETASFVSSPTVNMLNASPDVRFWA